METEEFAICSLTCARELIKDLRLLDIEVDNFIEKVRKA